MTEQMMYKMNKALIVAVLAGGAAMVSSNAWARDPLPCQSDADCPADGYCMNGGCAYDEDPQQQPASECQVDADCANGFSCRVIGAANCPPPPPRDPNNPDEPVDPLPCAPQEFRVCVPPPPAQCDPARLSADCSGGTICVTYTYESCEASMGCACPGNGQPCACDDEPKPEPICQTESQSYCVPPYLAPCEADADCGAGFTCEQEEVCIASCPGGSPGAPEPGGGDCTMSCSPSGTSYCRLIERTCQADADCGVGFVCQQISQPTPDVGSGTCSVDKDGNETCTPGQPSQPPVSESYCMPEGWERWGSPGGGQYDKDSPIRNGAEGEVVGAESARPPRQDSIDFSSSDEDGGCQVGGFGGSAAGSGLSMLAAFAGLLGWRRRRA
jgi:hypothetical protein